MHGMCYLDFLQRSSGTANPTMRYSGLGLLQKVEPGFKTVGHDFVLLVGLCRAGGVYKLVVRLDKPSGIGSKFVCRSLRHETAGKKENLQEGRSDIP